MYNRSHLLTYIVLQLLNFQLYVQIDSSNNVFLSQNFIELSLQCYSLIDQPLLIKHNQVSSSNYFNLFYPQPAYRKLGSILHKMYITFTISNIQNSSHRTKMFFRILSSQTCMWCIIYATNMFSTHPLTSYPSIYTRIHELFKNELNKIRGKRIPNKTILLMCCADVTYKIYIHT